MAARQSTCVALGECALLIEGAPGSGKSSLALALIDRGAVLIGDDSVMLASQAARLIARPHPETRGLLEVRGLGLLPFPVCEAAPVALVIRLDEEAPRFIEAAESCEIEGIALPLIRMWPGSPVLAIRAELAMRHYALGPDAQH